MLIVNKNSSSLAIHSWLVLLYSIFNVWIPWCVYDIAFFVQEQKLVPQELELDGLEESSEDKEKKEKVESENIDEAKKIVEALTGSDGESCKRMFLLMCNKPDYNWYM